jgi:hypothetical protein
VNRLIISNFNKNIGDKKDADKKIGPGMNTKELGICSNR